MALHFESEFITESVRVPVETYYLLKLICGYGISIFVIYSFEIEVEQQRYSLPFYPAFVLTLYIGSMSLSQAGINFLSSAIHSF